LSNTYSVRDVCERYAVSEHTVLTWIRSGELRAVNVGRRPGAKRPRWRIAAAALEAFEAARMPVPPPARGRRQRQREPDIIRFY
jgi:excisionase family DNA binding protein